MHKKNDVDERRKFILNNIASSKKGKVSCAKTTMAFVQAVTCEPANVAGSEKVCVYGPPTKLPPHLADFAPSSDCNIELDEHCPEIKTCSHLGYAGETHSFFTNEGFIKCALCGIDACEHCAMSMEISSESEQQPEF